jgi:hypothetical protein
VAGGVGFQTSVTVADMAVGQNVNFVLVLETYVVGVANSPQIWALHFRGHS